MYEDTRWHAGVQQFELMPALNDHPKFIECLADLSYTTNDTRTLNAKRAKPYGGKICERPKPKKCPHYNDNRILS